MRAIEIGYRRYDAADNEVIKVDGVVIPAPGEVASSSIPLPGGYQSEIAQALHGHWKTDAQGRLLDGNTGAIITQPEATDPLPKHFANRAALEQWQFDHSLYPNQLVLDGTKIGQPGREPAATFGSQADSSVISLQVNPPALIGTTPMPQVQAGADINLELTWPLATGQVRPRTNGFGANALNISFTVPLNLPPFDTSHTGSLEIIEIPGQEVTNRSDQLWVNDKFIVGNTGNSAPALAFTVGNPTSGLLNFQPGDKILWRLANPGLEPGTVSDIYIDFAIPSRY